MQSTNTIFKTFLPLCAQQKVVLNNENTIVIKNLRFNSIRFREENSSFFVFHEKAIYF